MHLGDQHPPPLIPTPEPFGAADGPGLGYAEFGHAFLTRVLHRDRVTQSIDRVLGQEFHLGPMGAGPGRRLARLTAHGRYRPSYAEEVGELAFRVHVPVDVDFELQIPLDRHRFRAEVVVPLGVRLRVVEPVTILWEITPPTPEEVELRLTNEARRSAMLQRLAGLEAELRAFLVRFVRRELAKPHVARATRIDLADVIDHAWEAIACQFLPPVTTATPTDPAIPTEHTDPSDHGDASDPL